MRIALALVTAFVLSACATTTKYEAILDSWVGSTESSLVQAWGAPQGVYEAPDGTRVLTWIDSANVFVPGTAPNYTTTVYGNTAYTTSSGGSPAMNLNYSCKTDMTIKTGKVHTWRWEGNNCVAR